TQSALGAAVKARMGSEEAWADLLLKFPIVSGDFCDWCMTNNFPPMFNMFLPRPYIRERMSSAVGLVGGGAAIQTPYGFADMTLGTDAVHKMIYGNFRIAM